LDGNQIVFVTTRDNDQGEIYTIGANGNGVKRITNNSVYDGMPSWSPDGKKIAYISYVNSQYRVWVMNTDGSAAVQLSQEAYSAHPVWSKDGSQIGYDADGDRDGWQELWVMNSDGSNRHQVYKSYIANTDVYMGSWNPGGSALNFTMVNWIYQNGQWYWTKAEIQSIDVIPGGPGILPPGDTNWYPDWGTTDHQPPFSSMSPLPSQVPYEFTVSWSADDSGGSGIASYDVQVKPGEDGTWTDWILYHFYTSAIYVGSGGQTYYFRTRAFDQVGNFNTWENEYQTFTRVESLPPETSVHHLPQFARDSILIQWAGFDSGGSGIKNYDIQYYDTQGGGWVEWFTGTSQTSQLFTGLPAHTYYFRSRATDNAGNIEDWPPDEGDAQVTFYNWLVAGTAMDILGAPLKRVEASISTGEGGRLPSNYAGKYTSYGTSAPVELVSWSKDGYTPLPETTLDGTADRNFDIFLPPDPNAIYNSDFEPDLAGWQTRGNVVSDSLPHTGDFSALLGTPFSFGESIQFEDYPGWVYVVNILADESGGLHTLWNEDNQAYYRYRDPAGNWSEKELAASNNTWDYLTSSLAVTPDGVPHVFWNSDQVIYYSYRISVGNWSPPVAISDVDHPSGFHISSSDTEGGLHITWTCQFNGMDEVCYRYKPAGGAWDDIVQLTENSSDYITGPGQMIVQDDVVHLLFRQDGTDYYARRDASGTWSVPEVICPFCPEMSGVAISVDKSGAVKATWYQQWSDGDYWHYDLYFTERSSSGTWLNPQYLFNNATQPQIAIDLQGRIHIAWVGGNTSGLFHAYRELDGSWHRSNPISDQWASTFELIADQQGSVHLIFPNGYTHWMGGPQWAPIISIGSSNQQVNLKATVEKNGRVDILWSEYIFSSSNLVFVGSHVVTSPATSTLSQAVQVDEASTNPMLSYFSASGGANLSEGMTFSMTVSTGLTSTLVYSSTGWSNGWQHHTYDMSPWAGQAVTLTFSVDQPPGYPDAWAYVDEVALGAVYPDPWVSMKCGSNTALPGEEFNCNLVYGNRGMVDSVGTTITMTLPVGLSFVEASVPPEIKDKQLIWKLESLPPNSGPYAIEIILAVDANTPLAQTLVTNVDINPSISELEKWNNHSESEIYVGALIYLPLTRR
jgi:hypothetical protein